jgi:group I intron endonuclease
MFIYLITNTINGKYYVGQTVQSLEKRWKQHINYAVRGKGFSIGNSIIKHGSENFKIESLCECPDQKSLDSAEQFFVWLLASSLPSFGYNLSKGGQGRGRTSNEETKRKIGLKQKGRKHSEESKLKRSIALKGRKPKPPTPETRLKMRNSQLGRKHPKEVREKISKGQLGNKRGPLSLDRKKQISEQFKGVKQSPEHIAKRIQAIII